MYLLRSCWKFHVNFFDFGLTRGGQGRGKSDVTTVGEESKSDWLVAC